MLKGASVFPRRTWTSSLPKAKSLSLPSDTNSDANINNRLGYLTIVWHFVDQRNDPAEWASMMRWCNEEQDERMKAGPWDLLNGTDSSSVKGGGWDRGITSRHYSTDVQSLLRYGEYCFNANPVMLSLCPSHYSSSLLGERAVVGERRRSSMWIMSIILHLGLPISLLALFWNFPSYHSVFICWWSRHGGGSVRVMISSEVLLGHVGLQVRHQIPFSSLKINSLTQHCQLHVH